MGIREDETEGDSNQFLQEPQGFFQCVLVEIRNLVKWIKLYKTFVRPLFNYIVHYIRMIIQMEIPCDRSKEEIKKEEDETTSGSIETEILSYSLREEIESDNIFDETLEALRSHATVVIEKPANEDEQFKLLEDQYREMFEEIESQKSANKTTTVVHSETIKEESLPIFVEFEKRKKDVDEEEELAKMNEEFKRMEEEQKRAHEEEMEKMRLKRFNLKRN